MNSPITIDGLAGDACVTLIPEAFTQKASALMISAQIEVVNDEATALAATNAEKQLKRIISDVETARKAIKQPVLNLGRDIDEKARQFVAGLESESSRINALRLEYAKNIENARREDERKQREAQEAQQKAAAELERQAQEASEKAESLKGKKAEVAKAEADRLKWEAEKAAIEAEQSEQPLAVTSAAGKLKIQWDHEVTDIKAFVCAYPQFCKIEIKRREFLEAINGDFFTKSQYPEEIPLSPGKPPRPPGIRVFESAKIK